MTVAEAFEFIKPPVEGSYPTKPDNYMSMFQLMRKGLIPRDRDGIFLYAMPSDKTKGYYYASPTYCRNMSDAEKTEFANISDERKRKSVIPGRNKDGSPISKKENVPKEKASKKSSKMYPDFEAMAGKRIVCFDTETTGVSSNDEIIQLSVWGLNGDKPEEIYQSYFKPLRHLSWAEAQAVNGISPEMVKNCPYIVEKISEIREIFSQADYVVGYNVAFDVNMLKGNTGIDIPEEKLADPLLYFRDKESGHHKLVDAVKFYCPDKHAEFEKNAHDAGADTRAALEVLIAQARKEGVSLAGQFEEEKDR